MNRLRNPAVPGGIQLGKANAIRRSTRHGIPDFNTQGASGPAVAAAEGAPRAGIDRRVIFEAAIDDKVCLSDGRHRHQGEDRNDIFHGVFPLLIDLAEKQAAR